MKLSSGKGHHHAMAEINITPFVDVVLVLLIIFMITAPLLKQGMSVEVPKAQAPEIKQTPQDMVLTIDSGKKIFLGDSNVPVPMEELTKKLSAIYQTKESKDLLIKADQHLQYGDVIRIMATATQAGVERIGMITEPEK